jgi:hypothetical protein
MHPAHARRQAEELTLPTAAWRMRSDAGYAAAWFRAAGAGATTPHVVAQFCAVPAEKAVAGVYAVRPRSVWALASHSPSSPLEPYAVKTGIVWAAALWRSECTLLD